MWWQGDEDMGTGIWAYRDGKCGDRGWRTGTQWQRARGHRDMVAWGWQDMGTSSVGPGDVETWWPSAEWDGWPGKGNMVTWGWDTQ